MSKPVEALPQGAVVTGLDEVKASGAAHTAETGGGENGLYGTSKYLSPAQSPRFAAEAELHDFAPTPCVCCGWTINDKVRKRTYFRVYENRVEYNWPVAPFCCLTKERCIKDNSAIVYFDKQPNRSGMACGCIPATCCGPPVIYTKIPRACCALIDLRPCCGETILYSPCDCFGLKTCCCCGSPCYQACSCPMVAPVKNGDVFLAKWKGALAEYWEKQGLDPSQMAKFTRVADRFCDFDNEQEIEAVRMER